MGILVINCPFPQSLLFFLPQLVKISISIHSSRKFLGANIHFIMQSKCPPGPHHLNGAARMPTLPFSPHIYFFFFLIHDFMITHHTLDLGYVSHSLHCIKFPSGKRWHPKLSNLKRVLKRSCWEIKYIVGTFLPFHLPLVPCISWIQREASGQGAHWCI